jgi:hypothetical protein
MRRRLVFAALFELGVIGLVAGMLPFSMYMVRQDRDWREQGVGVGPVAQVAVDVSMWWLKYWWAVAPMIVLGGFGLAALIVFSGRRVPRTAA